MLSRREDWKNRGNELIQQADKILKKFFKKDKYNCAIELYSQAAKQYKKSKDREYAANAYIRAADISKNKIKDINLSIELYIKAAKQYKYIDVNLADDVYNIAIPLMIENSDFRNIAKCYKELAEMWEKEGNINKSYKLWKKSKELYETEGSNMSALLCMVKCATILCEKGKYEKAAKEFEYIVKFSISHDVNKHMCKDYLGRALICNLYICSSNDCIIGVENEMNRYCKIVPGFAHEPIYEFVKDIIKVYESNDVDKFTTLCINYDKQYNLDNWTALTLLKVKNKLAQNTKNHK
jgi:tetratricopeptide (TPR) repeat protein